MWTWNNTQAEANEIEDSFLLTETGYCQECQREVHRDKLEWTYDRYGNPFKLVCPRCYAKVDRKIGQYVFDAAYAGESLYED